MTLTFSTLRSLLRPRLLVFALACAALLAPAGLRAQSAQFQDSPALRPPPGARVAIVEFDDLECPACANANPTLIQAAAKYHIPWIRHDFLIPYHTWSRLAAIRARWFDLKSKELGSEYRNEVFANQSSIYNPNMLIEFTSRFAQKHGVALPFAIDPEGKLNNEIDADKALANRIGVHVTPTIFIVTNSRTTPWIYVKNPSTDLFADIDRALAISHPVTAAHPAHHITHKH
ncbi:MAG TPA: thioredoxin domain-containing protein [Terracidiphilus sp.]|nr:thioredoxin domain-containing protein [Terracidiphilus sp.]